MNNLKWTDFDKMFHNISNQIKENLAIVESPKAKYDAK